MRRLATVLAVLMVLASNARAQLPCSRIGVPSPNGVTQGNQVGAIHAMLTWDPDGAGPLGPVLVVAGEFDHAGDVPVLNIAMWDGATWHTIGAGFDRRVNALAVFNGQLYAGGEFFNSAVPTSYLAVWNGSSWQPVAGGVDNVVSCLVSNGSELIVGGKFEHENGGFFSYKYLARYTGAGWVGFGANPLGPALGAAVYNGQTLVLQQTYSTYNSNNTLSRWNGHGWDVVDHVWQYAGGPLSTQADGIYYTNAISGHLIESSCSVVNEVVIERYDGVSVSQVLPHYGADAFVNYNGQFWALGYYQNHCLHPAGFPEPWLGVWDGVHWNDSPLNPGFGSIMCVYNGSLYLGGTFQWIKNIKANSLVRLDGTTWNPVGSGLDGLPRAATSFGNDFYIGGDFNNFGATPLGHMAKFDGTSWSSIGTANGSVTGLTYYSPNPDSIVNSGVVASGSFTNINGTAFNHIAKRDNTTGNWAALGAGLNAPAYAFYPILTSNFHADLIVGGQFTSPGNYIARWTGAAWQTMSTGMNNEVRALAVFGGNIYAGGYFTTASGLTCNFIAQWNGSFWAPVGGGMNDNVRALANYNGRLIAAGDFTMAGGVPANHVAAWNGTAWSALDVGVNDSVLTLKVAGSDLVAGGLFSQAGGLPSGHIASWDGTAWTPVGNDAHLSAIGMDGNVTAIAANSIGDLMVTGQFAHASGQSSAYAARLMGDPPFEVLSQPAAPTICPGGDATVSYNVQLPWYSPGQFQWYKSGVAIPEGATIHGTVFTHTTYSTLIVSNAQAADAGDLWCTVDNSCGQHLTSNTVPLTIGGPTCPSPCGSADYNCDGDLGTDSDIVAFFSCLSGSCPPPPCTSNADFNGDGDIGTDADIEAFFRVLGGGTC